ncbi:zinc finger BED domain-containing protein RICESLEEPER 2-like [Senna tora]|uniref:Zinc finger BED domain-containing protein RICESLEEPER 2-like n=1 Tax=Senna tora TaxID=362788 RepID=A0A834WFI7_9FABA|nr:zinc finger BED domain-containing protein RICESLEEPER 2-like [Senna tora]
MCFSFTSPSSRTASSHADGRHARFHLTQTRTASDFSSPSVHRSRLHAHRHTHNRQSVNRTRTTGNGQRHKPLFCSSISLAQASLFFTISLRFAATASPQFQLQSSTEDRRRLPLIFTVPILMVGSSPKIELLSPSLFTVGSPSDFQHIAEFSINPVGDYFVGVIYDIAFMDTSVNYTPNDANLMDDEPDIAFDMEAENEDFIDDDLQILNDSTNPSSSKGRATDDSGLEKEKPSKKPRKCTSKVWKSFTKIGVVDGKERARCNGCDRKYIVGSGKIGTSTLARHIPKCPGLSQYHNVGIMKLDQEGKLRSRLIDHKRVREVISMAIVEHDLPYSFVEYRWIRELHKLLNPDVKHISRNTAVADIWKFYLDQKELLKQSMSRTAGRICLTADCWTSYNVEGYICLTAHFVDENWKLNSKILSFCKMEPPHTGIELANKVFECLKEWGIDRKVFSLTLDNASANDNMQDILKEQLCLQNSLLCNGDFFHVRCCAHILNLIVQEGLKVTSGALFKIRESIKYVKASEGRMINFRECVKQVGNIDTKTGLRMDVPTRWNSTFFTLECAIKYRRAFTRLSLFDRHFKNCPTNEDWERGELMCEFLRPFYVITNLFSGKSYPTSNAYFLEIWRIECLLKQNLENSDSLIKEMATRMKSKFDKYWKDYSVILAIAAVLDPQMKLEVLRFSFKKLDVDTFEEKMDFIKSKLYDLYAQYESNNNAFGGGQASCSSAQTSPTIDIEEEEGNLDDTQAMNEYINYISEDNCSAGKSELDTYLEEAKIDPKYSIEMDVLGNWKQHRHRFPILSRMACDIWSIPITSVASESAFSIGSRVLNKYRCSLLPDNVQALICTRNWLHGFQIDDDDKGALGDDEASNIVQNIDGSKLSTNAAT